ncbi:hypothetical protein P280DRAFT_386887 [Massarina eburnea CBS 473.64]|uniref:Uncharacterized protein n=1 Tax=Massarina eburnea CBS 473.64 TaxID=1395130 RepID=A0A6A6SEZ5_9PLEO|nr:hypothetical protein P280DRAFT_386887 [Massarina eburnea CBS 473.64]
MNFVDVQPESFLDYAWTSPTPAPSNIAKPTKATRKQNRCCDQCRKGKRACDAAILEDTLLGVNGPAGDSPTTFHYSDVFGTLARCGNCEKTKKACTFQWLRSQRVSQVTPRPDSTPPVKRRRTQSGSQNRGEGIQQQPGTEAPPRTERADPPCQTAFVSQSEHIDSAPFLEALPRTFFDCFVDPLLNPFDAVSPSFAEDTTTTSEKSQSLCNAQNEVDFSVDHDSGFQDSPEEGPEPGFDSHLVVSNINGDSTDRTQCMRIPQKRRRRSSSGTPPCREVLYPSVSLAHKLTSSTSNAFMKESLLKVYQDSFEHHLSCWLTEKTCPVKNFEVSVPQANRPGWDCVYHRVFKLDRWTFVRGRTLSSTEDKVASKALNMAIIAFASQRAHTNQKGLAKYPFHGGEVDSDTPEKTFECEDFDSLLQTSTWHQARVALAEAEGVESFRVALALIIFSLAQKPSGLCNTVVSQDAPPIGSEPESQLEEEIGAVADPDEDDLEECQNMLSRLRIVIEKEGPPIYLEKGLRLLHSLRSRMTMTGTLSRPKKTPSRKKPHTQADRLENDDRITADLLFWLAMMFDTLSSAMHKRPLVVSLEDSDLPATSEVTKERSSYDEYLFSHQRIKPVRWPCSYAVASSLLCEAAPIKVLLFRKVTRIQSLLSRGIQGRKIEEAVQQALEVYEHWQESYAPFFQDVFDVRNRLPAHLRSWSICVTGHFRLATLLLADLIEIIDDAEASLPSQRRKRHSSDFIAAFRQTNCRSLSDMARCACPQENGSLAQPHDIAVDLEALLSEPWIVVLIRAFATAGVYLLELVETSDDNSDEQEDAFRRADDCICALWYLGRKSNMAMMAAKMLGDALKESRQVKRKGDLDSLVDLWRDFDQIDESFGECV